MSDNQVNSFSSTLSVAEIDQLRKPILAAISQLNTKKSMIRPNDFAQLSNYYQYILNTLNNMVNTKNVEMANPYGQPSLKAGHSNYILNPYQGNQRVISNPDGTTRIVEGHEIANQKNEWEAQFSESLLLNPPMYTYPPQNVYDISAAKNMRQQNRERLM